MRLSSLTTYGRSHKASCKQVKIEDQEGVHGCERSRTRGSGRPDSFSTNLIMWRMFSMYEYEG